MSHLVRGPTATIVGHSIAAWPSLTPPFEERSEWKTSCQITSVTHIDCHLLRPDTDYYKMMVLFPLGESDPLKGKPWEEKGS